MAGVVAVTDRFSGTLLSPVAGPSICVDCFNFTRGYRRCYSCTRARLQLHGPDPLDVIVPISYSVGCEELHHLLADYKRAEGFVARRAKQTLAAILWRFLLEHEHCLAAAAGVAGFDIVTVVPSSSPDRDERHPLREIVGRSGSPTGERFARVLEPTGAVSAAHTLDPGRFTVADRLQRTSVLLIDDTWTTGGSARSAAAALRSAGAEVVVALVIGRHVNRDWHQNAVRLDALAGRFDWSGCALCAPAESGVQPRAGGEVIRAA